MIEIQCPNCQRALKVPDKYVGTEGACNYCGSRVNVQAKAEPAAEPPIPVEGSGLLHAQLAEARDEIARLADAAESERLAREKAETDRGSALARVAELEAAVAQAAKRERNLASKAEFDRAQTELAETRLHAESLERELEMQREKAQQADLRLREVRGRLAAIIEDLPAPGDQPATAEDAAAPEASVCADFMPADAAAILVGAGSGRKKARWAWLVGLAAALLAVAAGLGVWGLSR